MKRPKLPIIKDWPKKGVNFIDIMPLFSNMYQFNSIVYDLSDKIRSKIYKSLPDNWNSSQPVNTYILAVDGRGLILGTALAWNLDIPVLTFRDVKKVPETSAIVSFNNEYSSSRSFSVDAPSLPEGDFSVIVVDDIIATGNTIEAVEQWIYKMNQMPGRSIRYLGSYGLIHLTNLGYKNKNVTTLWKMKE